MLKKISVILFALAFLVFVGCAANTHIIGSGAKGSDSVSKKQWYAIWGLSPMNKVDTKEMAGTSTDYEIRTEKTFTDAIISAICLGTFFQCRTVTVKK